jgi:DNA-binding NtrC family response regulator
VLVAAIPPLRERREDIEALARHFLGRLARRAPRRVDGIAPAALAVLTAYRWPGNVRELQNVLEFAALRAGAGLIDVAHLPDEVCRAASEVPGRAASGPEPRLAGDGAGRSAPLGVEQILAMVELCGGNRAEAARRLGISRVTLWKRLKQVAVRAAPEDG